MTRTEMRLEEDKTDVTGQKQPGNGQSHENEQRFDLYRSLIDYFTEYLKVYATGNEVLPINREISSWEWYQERSFRDYVTWSIAARTIMLAEKENLEDTELLRGCLLALIDHPGFSAWAITEPIAQEMTHSSVPQAGFNRHLLARLKEELEAHYQRIEEKFQGSFDEVREIVSRLIK